MRTWPCKMGATGMACMDSVWQDAPQKPSTLRMSERSELIPCFLASKELDSNAGRAVADKCSALMVTRLPSRLVHAKCSHTKEDLCSAGERTIWKSPGSA